MSGQPPRKIPRIISRTKNKGRTEKSNSKGECTLAIGGEALVKELSSEKVVVKDGCLVAVQTIKDGGANVIASTAPNFGPSGSRRITICVPESDTQEDPYVENQLPGVADEVESYPCQFCQDMVFLTYHGLERHAKLKHPEHFETIMEESEKIQKEWERRDMERNRLRERAILAKQRHESYTLSAVRFAHTGGFSNEESNERYDACKKCNMLVNMKHPTAMEHHLGAHRKNDELRANLLEVYGEEMVNRLSCHECRLVYPDLNKLNHHMEQSHFRRRKFVCKYCGHICMSMADLNNHKTEIHAIGANSSLITRTNRIMTLKHQQQQRCASSSQNYTKDINFSRISRIGSEETVCSTECAECGLKLVRPSLLVRHMLRVHNKSAFSCDISTRGLPNFQVEVSNDKIYWWCCEHRYIDRREFLSHRRQEHLELMISNKYDVPSDKETLNGSEQRVFVKQEESPVVDVEPHEDDTAQHEDESFQVIHTQEVKALDGSIFVLLVDGNEGQYIETRPPVEHIHNEIEGEHLIEEIVEGEEYDEYYENYGEDGQYEEVYYMNAEDQVIGGAEHIDEEEIEPDEEDGETSRPPIHTEEPTCEEMFEPII